MSTYLTIPIDKLVIWEYNEKIHPSTAASYELLKDKLNKKKQFRPIFVTPLEDEKYLVIAGNKRTRAWKELGISEVWVTILQFIQKEDGLWYVFRDGIEETERFQTKEDAMMEWATSDNEDFSYYDWGEFANTLEGYNLDWSRYMIRGKKPASVKTQLHQFLMGKDNTNLPEKHDCPTCGKAHAAKT